MPLVQFSPSSSRIRVEEGTSLHEAVLRAGLPIASACGADGLCGRCGVQVLRGSERLSPETEDERRTKQRNRVEPSLRLACQARVEGDVVITAAYW